MHTTIINAHVWCLSFLALCNQAAQKYVTKHFITKSSCTSLVVDSGGTVVLVSQDGIQRPPLRFPKGGHLLQFLSCLENGLLPHGQLDPPLWSQRGKVSRRFLLWGRSLPESGSKILNQPYLINKSIKRHLDLGIEALLVAVGVNAGKCVT